MKKSKTAIVSALVAAALATGSVTAMPSDTPGMDLARQLNEAFVSVADKVSQAVVVVEVTEKPTRGRRGIMRQEEGQGSGIIITPDGYILTNNHVVDNADKIEIYLKDGRMFTGEVVGTDAETDIAVVKIKGKSFPVARLGDSDKMRVGEFVIAIGHPYDLTYSVTVGHVSAIQRVLPYTSIYDPAGIADQEYIQTDAAINPGNSGGPLVNLDGEVIGINAMIEGDRRGIGLAIPINEAKMVKDRLISDGKLTRSWIGIYMANEQGAAETIMIPGLKPASDHATGVEVTDIVTNGPSAKSGLKAGDVIVAVDGAPIRNGRDLKNEVSLKKPGQSITVSVIRNNQRLPIKIITEAAPSPDDLAMTVPGGGSSPGGRHPSGEVAAMDYGFSAAPMNKDLAKQFSMEMTQGLVVTDVQMGSPADEKIAAGDIISKMNNKTVSSIQDFRNALKSVIPGQPLTMEVTGKDGNTKFRVLRAPGN